MMQKKPSTFDSDNNDTTHFGYTFVAKNEKAKKVRDVFDSVVDQYDVMNDVMSLGMHRLWKRITIELAQVRPTHQVLDIAAGSGDLSLLIAKQLASNGTLFVTDINFNMLKKGQNRLLDEGFHQNLRFLQADAECLPFKKNYFDRVFIGFGLRNVTNIPAALASMAKILKPGGRAIILEFSHPSTDWLKKIYDAYSFNIIPKLGEIIANDRDSYQYLVESIRMHPDAEKLKNMMLAQGFDEVRYHRLCGGIVCIHSGFKY
jgi:demethylmenaquinone methyltransferase/2-methoxy-6-polyprenyl-1,4-benzoquinol methylase